MGKAPKRKLPSKVQDAQSEEKKQKRNHQSYPLSHNDLPNTIDMHTFIPVQLPDDWMTSKSAKIASLNQLMLGRLMGGIHLDFKIQKICGSALLSHLCRPHIVTEPYRDGFYCDDTGEYATNICGQIPLSVLHDAMIDGNLMPLKNTKSLLNHLIALQHPQSSPWNQPFIRVYSTHSHEDHNLSVTYYVYFSRMVFELISDNAVKCVVENLQDVPCKRVMCTPSRPKVDMFSKSDRELLQLPEYRFSLPGVMKYIESTGYGTEEELRALKEPKGLTVTLYDFQKSTYKWMIDQEQDEMGLNGHFWEQWCFEDGGGSMYYFPIGGEFRFEKPPVARGGLLCEEMGLGKTVEIISLILGNPAPGFPSVNCPSAPSTGKYVSGGTLIIVPSNLISQWFDELRKRALNGTDKSAGEISCLNIADWQSADRTFFEVEVENFRRVHINSEVELERWERCTACPWLDESWTRGEWGDMGENEQPECLIGMQVEVRNLSIGSSGTIYRGLVNNIVKCGSGCLLKVRIDLASQLWYHDVVLTSYTSIKSKWSRKACQDIRWHRIVLDECQEIKVATNQIAAMCVKLEAERRWMVSGTPLISKISDLHGELNFLQIYPFCLSDKKDGFWRLRVDVPFQDKDDSALTLLYCLLDAVMMRHSKSQKYLRDNSPLVELPGRVVEWRNVSLTADPIYDYAYRYLECFAADSFERFVAMRNLSDSSSSSEWAACPHALQLRSLVSMMSRCITHTSTISLHNLDHLRRLLGERAPLVMTMAQGEHKIPLLSAEEILLRAQGVRQGQSGLNYQSNRVQASVTAHEEEQALRKTLEEQSVTALRQQVMDLGLPEPMYWSKLPMHVNAVAQSSILKAFRKLDEERKNGDGSSSSGASDVNAMTRKRKEKKDGELSSLHKVLIPGDCCRVRWHDKTEAEVTVQKVEDAAEGIAGFETDNDSEKYGVVSLGEVHMSTPWTQEEQRLVALYKHKYAIRKEPFVDLLAMHAQSLKSRQGCTTTNKGVVSQLHEGGFSTLYTLMSGQSVPCPLCLCEASRPTLTNCVHAYCFDCIVDVVKREVTGSAKCPVCRRAIDMNSLMEMKMDNVKDGNDVNDEEEEDVEESVGIDETSMDPASYDTCQSAAGLSSSSSSSGGGDGSSTPCEFPGVMSASLLSSSATKDSYADNSIQFLIPPLRGDSQAFVQQEVNCIPVHGLLPHRVRDVTLPSLSPTVLGAFQRPHWETSPRLMAVMGDMAGVRQHEPFAKFVIFTQYKECIKAVGDVLSHHGYSCASILTSNAGSDNKEMLRKFNQDPSCDVLLLTTGASATGLTLTIAHVLYMLEPCHNAAEEAQAISRVHRIGQTSSVKCVIFYGQNTCEERLLAMRQSNGTLTEVLSGENYAMPPSVTGAIVAATRRRSNGRKRRGGNGGQATKEERKSGEHFFFGGNLRKLLGSSPSRRDMPAVPEPPDHGGMLFRYVNALVSHYIRQAAAIAPPSLPSVTMGDVVDLTGDN